MPCIPIWIEFLSQNKSWKILIIDKHVFAEKQHYLFDIHFVNFWNSTVTHCVKNRILRFKEFLLGWQIHSSAKVIITYFVSNHVQILERSKLSMLKIDPFEIWQRIMDKSNEVSAAINSIYIFHHNFEIPKQYTNKQKQNGK